MNKKGFTLVELLVVVLIIGVLTSVALPMYQGAVDKSHFSTMLPAARAIKNAEEAFMMANGVYTSDPTELDVSLNDNNIRYTLETVNDEGKQFNVVRLENSKLNNVRLASYFDDNTAMAGQLHCEAVTGNERAQKLCEKLLGGQELTFVDGYTGYLLDQAIDQSICKKAGRSWSSSRNKCYTNTTSRCGDLNIPVLSVDNDQCGYTDVSKQEIKEEGFCNGTVMYGCSQSEIKQGGTCLGNGYVSCHRSKVYTGGVCEGNVRGGCQESSIYDGGKCLGKASEGCVGVSVGQGGECVGKVSGACDRSRIYSGGKCIAEKENGCPSSVSYIGTGCCEDYGKGFCLEDAPKC